MEKIINIDGRDIPFRSTGAFLLKYKAQFKRDPFQDLFKLEKAFGGKEGLSNIESVDLEIFYNLIWTLAKTANPQLPPPIEWLDTFGEFPLMDIIPELMDMILSSIQSTSSKKK